MKNTTVFIKRYFYSFVIPAQAGIQELRKLLILCAKMDTRLRGYDEVND
jgi:hypothetical protein